MLIVASLTIRALQGLSSSMIQTTSYAIIAVVYPTEQQKYLGILEASIGLGMLTGPAIGSVLYTLFGFKGTFYMIGVCFIVLAPFLQLVIPATVNIKDEPQVSDKDITTSLPEKGSQKIKVTYRDVLSRRVFFLTAISAFMAYFEY